MRAIVLAAGTGSRLGRITAEKTKGMVSVNGRLLIDYLLDFLDIELFTEIIVVGGFHYSELRDHLDSKKYINVRVVENKQYLKGNIYSLKTGLDQFSDDSFLITNVDHIYPKIMFEKMKKSFRSITAMCDFDRKLTADDMKVKFRKGTRKIERIRKDLSEYDCGYIGMTYVDRRMSDVYVDAVRKSVDKFGDKAVAENVLQLLADNEQTAPDICDLSGIGWYEVDTEEDLKKTESGILTDRNFTR